MTRIFLGGHEGPIPLEALPDSHLSEVLPSILLIQKDGVPFVKTDYASLGYNRYEIWCIGGAGGRGGQPNSARVYPDGVLDPGIVNWHTETSEEVMPANIWQYVIDNAIRGAGSPDYKYVVLTPEGEILELTPAELMEYENPDHTGTVTTYHDPYLSADPSVQGGAGGGGGLHVVSGDLADLPDSVPVVVGAAGIDAPIAQIVTPGDWSPQPFQLIEYNQFPSDPDFVDEWNAFIEWSNRQTGGASFSPPTAGGDGGASSFGDMCMASGGKGGGPSIVWDGQTRTFVGQGGDGGKGGTLVAGGGGLGGTTGKGGDGGWDGTIGSGGGGGRGGIEATRSSPGPTGSIIYQPIGGVEIDAREGGQGSFSYADTSVYGNRQFAAGVVPGSGGGAKAPGRNYYGSRSPLFNPEGLVLVRLLKLA